jgi:hypothetical protein
MPSVNLRQLSDHALLAIMAVETWPSIPVCLHLDHGDRPAVCVSAKSAMVAPTQHCLQRVQDFGAPRQKPDVRPLPLRTMAAGHLKGELNPATRGLRTLAV